MAQSTLNTSSNPQAWYKPMFSPEHGIYVVLLVSFLIGAAAAQAWKLTTTLALICAFCGFQAEHPLVMQIKQRRSLKPRFIFWGGFYAVISGAIALWLYLSYPILLWIYVGAIAALIVDAFSVVQREQKSIFNELVVFAAVCLSTPFAYAATTGTISASIMGLWALNTLYFSSTIFTVKLRKPKTSSAIPGVVYHAIASLIIFILYWFSWLSPVAALAFGLALLKFGIAVLNQEWYCSAKIQFVATLESVTAFAFLIIVALSVLPARLTTL
ncbi:MAG: YwiC-like family protein [Chlorogloeopsis fritschii C42_A2020_084]|uniref:YwiC-like family protein n=1 Tax=Chlorogloeopsis fritschii TaxID=1124 RepID=UPI0019F03A36|nr:YwiC-like family protein [Chlorogloeopsis fritschii]MBF2008793.1 YwiC-like family protein [Chlorogloeopsis fritschii C42_A2020_084]